MELSHLGESSHITRQRISGHEINMISGMMRIVSRTDTAVDISYPSLYQEGHSIRRRKRVQKGHPEIQT